MIVSELIKILSKLEQDKEIRFDTYEFVGDFKIGGVMDEGEYYNIVDPEEYEE